jgi:hypothetical protein
MRAILVENVSVLRALGSRVSSVVAVRQDVPSVTHREASTYVLHALLDGLRTDKTVNVTLREY